MPKINFAAPLEQEAELEAPEVVEALPPAEVVAFDLEAVKLALAPHKAKVAAMVAQAKQIVIKDEASQVLAVETGTTIRNLKKKIEDMRKATVQPYNDHVKDVNNLAKAFTETLDGAERELKAKISTYQTQLRIEQEKKAAAAREEARKQQERIDAEQRAIREEAARQAREAAEELRKKEEAGKLEEAERQALQRKIDEETAAANAPVQVAVAPVIEEIPKMVRTESGSAHQKKRWVCRIVNPDAVPRNYCAPVQTLLNEAVKAGIRQIAGCVIEEISETTFR